MKNKVVIVTGGTSGIGRALAQEFGRQGAKVVITGRNLAALAATEAQLTAQGIEVLALQADARREADNQHLAQATLARFGRIDVLINNAGISMRALFNDADLDVIRQVMDVNFYGAVSATKFCLPHIIEQQGSVVGISSIAGYRGLPARTGYSASKFALQGFLEALRSEMIPHGVHVLTACPGFTASSIRERALAADGSVQGESPRDEGQMMTAEECAQHIYRATVKRRKILLLTTQGKITVWLNKLFPGWMDRVVYNYLAKETAAPLAKA
ncbi:MAG: SDR family oxidoreductase [Bernardetiaceae bacterium]|jgi:short-subunit dehydrogenase|nr:SDR family oxidoreductase [Bernardetiaceae bacterium]